MPTKKLSAPILDSEEKEKKERGRFFLRRLKNTKFSFRFHLTMDTLAAKQTVIEHQVCKELVIFKKYAFLSGYE